MKPLKSVAVRVPATTSNLGPAFDCVGLALGLYNEVAAELYNEPGPIEVSVSGEGEKTLPRGKDNLVARALRAIHQPRSRVVLRCVNRIPLSRGLGSSAAAYLSGLFAARALFDAQLTDEQLIEYAAATEGHPDNAAPAVFGGLVLSLKTRGGFSFHALKAHKDLAAVVCAPSFELATKQARAVVPRTTLLENAVHNVGRAMLLTQALAEGRSSDLAAAMEDKLHQPHRAGLIKGFEDVLRAARETATCGSALSGAGPSVLALCRRSDGPERIGRAMEKAFRRHGVESRSLILPVDREGIQVRAR